MSDPRDELDWVLSHRVTCTIGELGPQERSNLDAARARVAKLRSRIAALEGGLRDLLETIEGNRKDCVGDHYIYTAQIGTDHCKALRALLGGQG